jgi:hypothetical protein
MPGEPLEPTPSPAARLLRRTDQVAISALVPFAMVSISIYWISQAKIRHRLIDIDRTGHPLAAYSIDINAADWSEPTTLYVGPGNRLHERRPKTSGF